MTISIRRPNRVARFFILCGFSAATAQAISLLLGLVTVAFIILGASAAIYKINKGLKRLENQARAREARMSNALEQIPASVQFFTISGGVEETNAEGELVLTMDDEEFIEKLKGVKLWHIQRCDGIGSGWKDTSNTWPGDEKSMLDKCTELYTLELQLNPSHAAFFRGRAEE